MSHAKGMKRFLVAAAVAFLAGASAASAGVRDLSSTIEVEKSFAGAADDVVVHFTLRNDSAEDLYVLSWQTPLKGIQGNLFEIRRDGEPVAYTGRLYKRAKPVAADFLRIPAGESISADVELSSVYDMSRTGEYSIQYRVPAGPNKSNVVYLGLERDERALEPLPAEITAGGNDKYLSPSYVSCSTTRQSTLVSALSNAESMSLRAKNYLLAVPSTSRSTDPAYKTWFGSYTSTRWSNVQTHYNNIYSAFNTQRVTFYCDCTDSSYAYVYANQPYRIHLCGAFWNAPMTGTDSKAGTLIHEMSHFTVVAGTQDYAYGQTACKNLAISSPTSATNNADNHEYFAETR
ncbi:MAG TPA: M35 family metallo-endopeptidase [Thermoanaerobaculia bacterium]|nr:M35 family metallo-endopeptidase [Thermoanaerobaculia bacterium]